jgi:hypothetical protein
LLRRASSVSRYMGLLSGVAGDVVPYRTRVVVRSVRAGDRLGECGGG